MVYRLNDPEFLADPAPVLAQMRAEGPLVQVKMPIIGTIWMTTTDAASRTLLKNPDLFRRDPGPITGKPLSRRFWWMPGFFKPLRFREICLPKQTPSLRVFAPFFCSASGLQFY